ncbi:TPA: hypothetical protein HA265_07120 [Candidatus Woesearchaeota archaeon]|nr:hypothetical protein [Candidatus Woesearchaeota archaeon]
MVDWDNVWKAVVIAAGVSAVAGYFLRNCESCSWNKKTDQQKAYEMMHKSEPMSQNYQREPMYAGRELATLEDRAK